ncbi:PREDICTED: uncharacterized protein LOC104785605 isoform X3 [Camelina sativa]|uniref:Uncharacterized protein LOC104785605 isoform X1 n=1 Tax=Camelina sativa TaxID=90675 RepID=A0ABM0Z1M7_CAMSA|nr:PREDICTED: uncharacterized protein LOC104785605 isoform X1 [Camelina sativa]XP_010509164.1 PREDICTED: uncharacterized protein LOC104785605 isoform X2 [Camelina sativa]XP_010509165.1 PREDICTED: uncharacterized protein LOC104785605 isoform X3 [Camelina sativa]
MSVAGVHRLTLSLPPKCYLRNFISNGKHTPSLLPHRYSVFHHSHRLVTSSSQKASNKSDAEAEAESSYGEGEMLDKNGTSRSNPFVSEELLKKLKRYGLSGILSYGLLNTVYYSTAFLLVWFYVAPAPGKMGYLAAAERFLKVMAMVWAGSQVTKLIRIGGAVALAPIVDRGLSWFTVKCKFESQGKAFGALVGICLGLALMLFVVVTLLWA